MTDNRSTMLQLYDHPSPNPLKIALFPLNARLAAR